jgi:hypothetical protein
LCHPTQLQFVRHYAQRVDRPDTSLPPVKLFRHYKGGEYAVIGEGIHTETEEDLVFYYSTEDQKLYARPRDMFNSDVEWEGETLKRFTPIE